MKICKEKSKYADLIKRTVPGDWGGFSHLKFTSHFTSIQRTVTNKDKQEISGKVPDMLTFIQSQIQINKDKTRIKLIPTMKSLDK